MQVRETRLESHDGARDSRARKVSPGCLVTLEFCERNPLGFFTLLKWIFHENGPWLQMSQVTGAQKNIAQRKTVCNSVTSYERGVVIWERRATTTRSGDLSRSPSLASPLGTDRAGSLRRS